MPKALFETGNLGKDITPEMVNNPGQPNARINFSVALNEGRGDNAKTGWLDCTIFGKHADTVGNMGLKKGDRVHLSGRLSLRETGKDSSGQYDRPIWTMIVNFLESDGPRHRGNGGGGESSAAPKDEIPDF